MEIITGVERRRRWRLEEKLRIVAEVERPGVSFADAARRHEVSRGLLWNWRRQVRRGELVPDPMPTFVPVQIMAERAARHQAEARATGAEAMIAHLRLFIAKLERDRFGQTSERSRRLLDQLELQLEELPRPKPSGQNRPATPRAVPEPNRSADRCRRICRASGW